MALPSPISVTPVALDHIKALLDSRGKPSHGIRLGVRSKGARACPTRWNMLMVPMASKKSSNLRTA